MKHSYNLFLAIFLIFIIIGFSYYKQVNEQEGMQNMESNQINVDPVNPVIIKRGNKKIRRRKREQFKIGNWDIGSEFEKMGDKFQTVESFFKKIRGFFEKIGQGFQALGTNIKCAFEKIVSLPTCMMWYMLDVFGRILYFPINFIVWWISKMGIPEIAIIEKEMWKLLEQLDQIIHSATGVHIIHFPDDVINRCYKCKTIPFPTF